MPTNNCKNLAPIAIYIHFPFCRSRCSYCAVNTYNGHTALIPTYLDSLQRELRAVMAVCRLPAHTIYFGGGTPSLAPPDAIHRIIQQCRASFTLSAAVEITLEANPGTLAPHTLTGLRQTGVNRLSLGMQSAVPGELRLFRRRHTLDDVRAAVHAARQAGVANINLDLIYGIPGQPAAAWQHSLETALTMEPDHISLYSLTVENGTPLANWIAHGQIAAPDPDRAADRYEWAAERLQAAGFEQYEISNWARPGAACRHNVHVWQNRPYLGFGAGAHGFAEGVRYANVLHPADYVARLRAPGEIRPFPCSAAVNVIEPVDRHAEMVDTMIMGLRLTQDGVSPTTFYERFGRPLDETYGATLAQLRAQGLVDYAPGKAARLTSRGRLLGNHVFAAFV
jgi:oxygen-independent coproporphyrinogen III oxidase